MASPVFCGATIGSLDVAATAPPRAAEEVTAEGLAHAGCLDITPPGINPPHPDLQRPAGTSIHRAVGSATCTSRSLLAAENRLLAEV
ncbi:hypothetical protein [Streptomyces sp. JHA19]|uniref:hypothetical protein n=1 Tax=Streptomyces sp. JHA19 TaxID=1577588 RepID=UPI0006E1C9BB|nr:hypothetical protein [Streptomyces sp. JHA19]